MNSQSIEFDRLTEDSETHGIVRKSFRVPTKEGKNAWVVIQNRRYPVTDICLSGIGICLEDPLTFIIEQMLNDCELSVDTLSIKGLNGQVIHVTSVSGQEVQCGIQWVGMEEKTADQIAGILLKMKEQVLKQDSMSPGEG